MAVRIDQVLEYLDHHPVCYYADNVESLLGMLSDIYTRHNVISSAELDSLVKNLDAALETIPAGERMRCGDLVNVIRKEHEQQAFVHGVIVGLLLSTEIRSVITDSAV